MEKAFWFNSWELEGHYTSFHRKDIHPYAIKYLPPFALEGQTVFVPLCGKSLDLLYFSRFATRVIGVEIVEKAIHQFFEDNQLAYRQIGSRFVSGNITILCRDFFSLKREDIGPFDVVYDRAALVALPRPLRMRYLQTLEWLAPVGTLSFLNTLEYAPTLATPPFSISPDEVASYFPNYAIDHVECQEVPTHGMVRKYNLSYLKEHGFMMRKLYDSPVLIDIEDLMETA
ncbi:class I SAM-dependent methyltransferase [Spirosoma endbachense]|uniref:thiopurine S-methyltransferase n=1 Tax=Spirosoma endbachense TaxID=2666025 RepID=A0A6P1VTP4_9BACT|nr:thiopurine S-methyltransferase [Spirosoma endbachense]QHV96065.1 thiopurine S-methyltransferase [Spirosoma endbachense]